MGFISHLADSELLTDKAPSALNVKWFSSGIAKISSLHFTSEEQIIYDLNKIYIQQIEAEGKI